MKYRIIDMHAHLMLKDKERDAEDILLAIERYDISRLYVSTLEDTMLTPDSAVLRECNRETLYLMHRAEDRIRGYCYVNPNNCDTMDELKRGFAEGMSGVKLWMATYCDDPKVFPVVEFCIEHRWPVLIHSFHKAVGQLPNETTGVQVANLARRYPNATLIMAHLGANCYHGVKAVRDCQNVTVDISGTIYRRDDLDYTVEMLGADRVLFGTDLPQPGNFLSNVGRVLEADLSDEQRNAIFWKNAVRIMGEGLETQ